MEHKSKYPVSHVVGFLFSLILTFVAVFVALKMNVSYTIVMWIIGSLAVIQAGLQLFMFMHVTEGEDRKTNVINMAYAVFVAIVIVAGSIWVLTSGHAGH
ncbi:cytochrome aa3 quinol oxidase subunit IV [Anoxybacillus flavithermus]|uniref:Quinol oxidase subunit 4 n=1 Tax=Anoxybacillus flavithermus TaxID=33934 RepID=A0AAX1ZZN2_9BACL|nr:cytochrome aa3 quinol oxidase subunit IV [Anoxybacillus flavithermus]MBE2924566.1 cytochrome aa3 quinol oxidase subunit IV [Anoxybacillus flavithermus]MBE2927941.1 cytochrome aa3 quinol oxidase subunit IV [Anoxybacillus flavithermus]MBE2938671.1 cytochrome aa3 quinol oxidase subunit IV [Anoxybacillus flavithermus]MBE2946618.1 cytochrome aa3 quinol oxidase subunit IV [Anoxybacillus flavithermus]MBE2949225.1 cytochrome aa3 quinol oxidase subunit IV [Anoxybacillus flavithermus]